MAAGPVRAFMEGSPQVSASVPAETAVGVAEGLVLAANAKRKGLLIQNTGTTIIYLVLGVTVVTVSAYHVALKGGTVADDGTGATYTDDAWVGPVRALSSGAGGTCVILEMMTGSPSWDAAADPGTFGF